MIKVSYLKRLVLLNKRPTNPELNAVVIHMDNTKKIADTSVSITASSLSGVTSTFILPTFRVAKDGRPELRVRKIIDATDK